MNRTEFRALYARYGPAVRARLRAMCGNDADADEVLQDAFLRAWKARDRFDGVHPLAWLQTIARNTALDRIRARRPWRDDPEAWLAIAAPRRGDGSERIDAARLLDQLSAEDATLLRLRHGQGWRLREIAEHFQTSERSIRRRLDRLELRARALLRVEDKISA